MTKSDLNKIDQRQVDHLTKFANKLKASLVKPKPRTDKSDIELRSIRDRKLGKVDNSIIYEARLI